jgi:hypothetical protein
MGVGDAIAIIVVDKNWWFGRIILGYHVDWGSYILENWRKNGDGIIARRLLKLSRGKMML